MRLSDIIKSLRGIFERKRKNPVQLDNDSNLESKLKPLKISNKNTPLQISEDTIDVKGSLKVNGSDVQTGTEVGATELNELSDVSYSSGDLTISSLDTIVAGADLTLDVTGDIELNADGGDVTIKDDSSKYFSVSSQAIKVFHATSESNFKAEVTSNRGATTLSTSDAGGTNSGHLSIIPDGVLKLEGEDSGVYIKEYANAGGDSAGYGQLWVSGSTPNELAFTDDAGTDIVGIGKYHYTVDVVNYSAGQLASFIPLGGYIIERTSTSSANEFISMIAPYNGTLVKAMFRSEVAQNGTIQFDIHESSDGTEVPAASAVATKDTVVNIADDTTQDFDFSSMTTGDNVITKGRIYAFKITTPSNSIDTNVTLVFKWDITS